ncbi:probable calcium-binding protein CML34 [Aplysia californica]|uniref:Probable calcium-binding protein CML34 n=1 Tax=Aplysia californica TaxID=6500 RepID=A0ABM0JYQ5_APLCA|nr:probable calcium-binding protein CML34 [Aplysia californica]
MAGRNRKVPDHIVKIFDKYTANNVRVLSKAHALEMLKAEFGLEGDEAEVMFNTFDKDKNGKLSVWEFQMFCTCMGEHAQEIITKFKELDKDGSGQLDGEEAREGLKELKTGTGRLLSEKEVDFFIQTAGDGGVIDLGHFTNLLYRLKLYNAPAPK